MHVHGTFKVELTPYPGVDSFNETIPYIWPASVNPKFVSCILD